MLAKVFARAVEASFHCGDTGAENFGDLRVAAAFLDERQERAVLRAQLREGMPQGIELLRVHGSRGLRDIFVLFAERQKNSAQFLPAQLINAGVAREPKQPRLKLRRRLQPINRAHHLDEDLLRQVLYVIAATGHGVDEPRDSVLIADDELTLGGFFALLSPPNEIGQRGR
ncbi:MAG: hypothetical protein ABIQ12_09385 [Opitutaceae bacterium]